MESEMFVANEYVAACWEVTCIDTEHGSFTVKGKKPTGGFPDNDRDGFYEGLLTGQWFYTGKINGHSADEHWSGKYLGHPVTIGDETNAS